MKSEIIYFDENENIVSKENATKCIIREIDENGNLVNETFGILKSNESATKGKYYDSILTAEEKEEIERLAKEYDAINNIHM